MRWAALLGHDLVGAGSELNLEKMAGLISETCARRARRL
jgi:hypothetical protein